ncbi:MAG: NAD(+)/NADH kinase, partial [Leptolyngbya sp.]|nr:NAD(+)/NADH kinase [Leptolyngbya sp.]
MSRLVAFAQHWKLPVPKVGIIYNDIKPVAQQVAREWQEKLEGRGLEVVLATGAGGILGYSSPDRPMCHTPLDSLVPPHFDGAMLFALVLGGDGTVL